MCRFIEGSSPLNESTAFNWSRNPLLRSSVTVHGGSPITNYSQQPLVGSGEWNLLSALRHG